MNKCNITIIKIWKENKKFRLITYIQLLLSFIFSIYLFNTTLKYNISYNTLLKISIIFFILILLHILIPYFIVKREINFVNSKGEDK